jgi:hypothetical protein
MQIVYTQLAAIIECICVAYLHLSESRKRPASEQQSVFEQKTF